jgi:alpha-tubulin suppressor-like RCC1 family protein
MFTKIFSLIIFIILAGCKKQDDFYNMPIPAKLEYGLITESSTSFLSAVNSSSSSEDNWVSVATLDFGRRPFGSTSKNTIFVKNTGNLSGTVTNIWLDSADKEHFNVTSFQCSVLARGQACSINLEYTPNTVGSTPAVLHIAYSDGSGEASGQSKRADLAIKATANNLAFLKFEQDKIDIKTNTVGYTLSSYFKVLYNGSNLAGRGLVIEPAKGVAISDPTNSAFKIDHTNSTCGEIIQADCVIKVDFAPTVVGEAASSFNVNYFNGAEVLRILASATGAGLQAKILADLQANTLDFGNVVVNPPAPVGLSLPVIFTGSVPADNVSIYYPVNNVFTVDTDKSKTTCGSQIAGSCALFIKFNPNALASEVGTITIEYTSNGQNRTPLKISLKGRGVNPALLAANVQSQAFGSVPAYKTMTKTFTLTNSGDVAITQLSALIFSDANNYSGSFESKCSSLAPAATCLLSVNFRPKTNVATNSEIKFSYFNGREFKNIILSANGAGSAPLVLEGSRIIDFGNVMIGKAILPAAISTGVSIYGLGALTNANQLVINPKVLNSPFAFTTSTCNPPLDPKKGNGCAFGVGVTTNSGFPADSAVLQNFTMTYTGDTGIGGAGVLNFTAKMTPRIAPALAFGVNPEFKVISVNDSHSVTYTLKNQSPYFSASFKSVAIVGSTNFSITTNSCASGLTASASCNIIVKFNPKAAGNFSAKLNYTYNNQIADVTVVADLNATGSEEVTLAANASTVDFGNVYVGDAIAAKTVNLKYLGDTNWTHSISAASPFKITPVNCGVKADCQLKIEYTPTAVANHSSVAELIYSPALDEVGIIKITLKGNALSRAPVLSVTPSTLSKTLVGASSIQTITIKNTGNIVASDLEIAGLGGPLSLVKEGTTCTTGKNLQVGESCLVKVLFTPNQVGTTVVNLGVAYDSSVMTAKLNTIGTQMIQVFAGGFQTCIINEVGNPICWGRNTAGQLGQGSKLAIIKKPIEIPSIKFEASIKVLSLAVGDSHTCAIVSAPTYKARVACWGSNEHGRLGLGETTVSALQPKLVDLGLDEQGSPEEILEIAAGFEHTCALARSGKVKCWGGNTSGQLGYGNKEAIGSTKASMTNLKAVDLGARKALSISAGAGHSCAVLDNGASKCWGDNFYGQLGAGNEEDKIGINSKDMTNLEEINLGVGFVAQNVLASSGAFTCALSVSGEVKCFGKTVADESSARPFYGVLGNCWARAAQNSAAVSCSANPQLKLTNSIGYLASDMGDKLSKVSLNTEVKKISLGSNFACALSKDASMKCWGINEQGQLGVGGTSHLGETANETLGLKSALSNVVDMATGYEHACGVMGDNTLKCWGSGVQNANGLAAFGNYAASVVPSGLPVVYDGR